MSKLMLKERNMKQLIKLQGSNDNILLQKDGTEKNKSVLIAKKSELVDVLIANVTGDIHPGQKIFTIDSTNLVRAWRFSN